MSGSIATFELDKYDPIARLMFKKLGITAIGTVLLYWLYSAFEGVLLPWLEDFQPSFADYTWFILLGPIFWGNYALSYIRIPNLFQRIESESVMKGISDTPLDEKFKQIKSNFNSLLWPLVAWVVSITIIALIRLVQWKHLPPSFISSTATMWINFLPQLITIYIGTLVVIRELATVYWMIIIFKHARVKIRPLDPDGAGGLGFIGRYYLGLASIVIAIALWISVFNFLVPAIEGQPVNLDWEILFTVILYVLIAPASFILPIWSIHTAMKREKEFLLRDLSSQFETEFKDIKNDLQQDAQLTEQKVRKIKSLLEMEQVIVKAYPTWPFNSQTLRNFSLSALLPVITSLSSLFVDVFLK